MGITMPESPKCCTETVRRARKAHWCCECGDEILPGFTYRYLSGIWDGRAESFKTCLDCLAVIEELIQRFPKDARHHEFGIGLSQLWQWVADNWDEHKVEFEFLRSDPVIGAKINQMRPKVTE